MATATRLRTPVGGQGLPYIGEALTFLRDPATFVAARRARYGPIFTTRFLGQRVIVLPGAEAQRIVLAAQVENFPWRDGNPYAEPFLAGTLALTDGLPHDIPRKAMSPAFHRRSLTDYVAQIQQAVDTRLGAWGAAGVRPFFPEAHRITFSLAFLLLFGADVFEQYDDLNRVWTTFMDGAVNPVQLNLPFTPFGAALRAQKRIEAHLQAIITQRRDSEQAQGASGAAMDRGDLLDMLLRARDQHGIPLADEVIRAELKVLLFASYDTTPGTMVWLLVELLRHPALLARARQEVIAHCGADAAAPLTYEMLRQMTLLDAAIKEALRVHPQSVFSLRGVRAACEIAGYAIPAKSTIMLVPAYTHRMPEYFADPAVFDPDRFLPPRQEDVKHPYAFIGFGGGPRICIGEALARIEIKVFFAQLVRRFDLGLVERQDLTPRYVPSRPKGNVLITYSERADTPA
ncbi:MAG: cytochrome P450 [Ktedonobacterales bacterium]